MLVADNNYFRGERFIRYDDQLGAEDYAVMPLYDVNGYIAGIQTAVSFMYSNNLRVV